VGISIRPSDGAAVPSRPPSRTDAADANAEQWTFWLLW